MDNTPHSHAVSLGRPARRPKEENKLSSNLAVGCAGEAGGKDSIWFSILILTHIGQHQPTHLQERERGSEKERERKRE